MSSLEIEISAPIKFVWDYIADIESHVAWMDDAESVVSTSELKNAVDAFYVCDTKVGPLKVKDKMRVTKYDPPTNMEIEHIGAVSGRGIFRLEELNEGSTKFIWEENLVFPWYMGANIGKIGGMKLLHRIWRNNLKTLKHEIENKFES